MNPCALSSLERPAFLAARLDVSAPGAAGRLLDGVEHNGFPEVRR